MNSAVLCPFAILVIIVLVDDANRSPHLYSCSYQDNVPRNGFSQVRVLAPASKHPIVFLKTIVTVFPVVTTTGIINVRADLVELTAHLYLLRVLQI